MQLRMKIKMWKTVWPLEKIHKAYLLTVIKECSDLGKNLWKQKGKKGKARLAIVKVLKLDIISTIYESISYSSEWDYPIKDTK